MKNNLKIIFFGTPDFVVPVFKALLNNEYNISGVFSGHGPVELTAKKHGIKVFSPISLKKDEQVFEEFKSLKPDLCVVAAYGKILPQKFLDVPRCGFLNIHPSLLPKYRGPSPIQTALLNGDKETGVTVMLVDAEVDHGPLLASREFSISNFQFSNHDELANEIFELGAKLLVQILPEYIAGKIKPKEQNHSQATFTKMFTRDDGKINWNSSAKEIYNRIRALNPEPGTWTTWKGKVINISTITSSDDVSPQMADLALKMPGTVEKISNDIAVATKKCYLILKSIQLEGGKEMDAKSFVNGHPEFLASTLE